MSALTDDIRPDRFTTALTLPCFGNTCSHGGNCASHNRNPTRTDSLSINPQLPFVRNSISRSLPATADLTICAARCGMRIDFLTSTAHVASDMFSRCPSIETHRSVLGSNSTRSELRAIRVSSGLTARIVASISVANMVELSRIGSVSSPGCALRRSPRRSCRRGCDRCA